MNFDFHKKIGLSSVEFKLLLFVFFSFIFGLALNQLFNISSKSNLLEFDYSYQDSIFLSLSRENEEEIFQSSNTNVVSKQEVFDFNDTKLKNISSKVLPAEKSIDLNKATKSELTNLPGIGEKTAEAIIVMREKNGKFRKLEELKKVKGIGDKKFEKIIKYIYIK